MNITIVGTGYVGLVTGACFAEMGVNVTCVDKDKGKIEVLTDGGIPIYEPGLEELVSKNMTAGRLKFSASLPEAMKDTEVIILAVGTPPDEDGSADLNNVLEVAGEIGEHLERYVLVVNKSTVPVGTASKVEETIKKKLGKGS